MTIPTRPVGLIDTMIVIDGTKKRPDAQAFLTAQGTLGPPPISVVTSMEAVEGARNGKDLADIVAFLTGFREHPVSPTASVAALDLMRTFTLSHGLGMSDALIAATARELGLTLYTLNTRHFVMIPGLQVVRPY